MRLKGRTVSTGHVLPFHLRSLAGRPRRPPNLTNRGSETPIVISRRILLRASRWMAVIISPCKKPLYKRGYSLNRVWGANRVFGAHPIVTTTIVFNERLSKPCFGATPTVTGWRMYSFVLFNVTSEVINRHCFLPFGLVCWHHTHIRFRCQSIGISNHRNLLRGLMCSNCL